MIPHAGCQAPRSTANVVMRLDDRSLTLRGTGCGEPSFKRYGSASQQQNESSKVPEATLKSSQNDQGQRTGRISGWARLWFFGDVCCCRRHGFLLLPNRTPLF